MITHNYIDMGYPWIMIGLQLDDFSIVLNVVATWVRIDGEWMQTIMHPETGENGYDSFL